MLGILASLAFFAFALVVAWRSPRNGALLCVALLPWEGLAIDLGIRITAYMLAITALVPAVLLRRSNDSALPTDRGSLRVFHPFVAFVVVWSLFQVFNLPSAQLSGGALREPLTRALLQIVVFGLVICPIWFLPVAFRSTKDLHDAGRMYIVSCFALAAIGFVQIGIWYLTGSDPLPIGVLNQALGGANPDLTRSGMLLFEGESIYRMSSLGGEPKGLGQSLVVAIFLLQTCYVYPKDALTMRGIFGWLFLVLAVFATQSSSAFGLLAVALIVAAIASVGTPRRSQMRVGLATGTVFGLLAGLFAFGTIAAGDRQVERLGAWTANILTERTVGRGTVFEDFDQAILKFLNDNPEHYWLGVGLGNIHLHADPYLSTPARRYAGGKVFFAKSGYLKIISEAGIVGLLLFLFACLNLVRRLGLLVKAESHDRARMLWLSQIRLAFVFLTIAYLARVYIGGQFFACAGIVTAACSVLMAERYRLGWDRATRAGLVGDRLDLAHNFRSAEGIPSVSRNSPLPRSLAGFPQS